MSTRTCLSGRNWHALARAGVLSYCLLLSLPGLGGSFDDNRRTAAALEADIRVAPDKALALLEPMVTEAWAMGDTRHRNLVELLRGIARGSTGQDVATLALADELEGKGAATNDPGLLALAALLRLESGLAVQDNRLLRWARSAHEGAKASGDSTLQHYATIWLAKAEILTKDRAAARRHFDEALALATAVGNKHRQSHTLYHMTALNHRDAPAVAMGHGREALTLAESIGSVWDQCNAQSAIALALGHLGDPKARLAALAERAEYGQRTNYLECEVRARMGLANVFRAAGDFERTLVEGRLLVQLGDHDTSKDTVTAGMGHIVWALTGLGRGSEAEAMARELKSLAARDGVRWDMVEYDQRRYEAELTTLGQENALKDAALARQALIQRMWWGIALALLVMLVLTGLLLRKRAVVAQLRAAAAVAERDREVAQANLQRLQAQIKPHFLWNTLANVQQLVRVDAPTADKMLGHLIVHLQGTLAQSETAVSTLGQEFRSAAAYLEVIQLRFGGRLTSIVELPPALEDTPFPTLVLQTLVENAVKHGIEPKVGPARIALSAHVEGVNACVTVSDDGVGLGPTKGMGVGLRNTRERLAVLYGDAGRLSLAPNVPTGVVASVSVPRAVS